MKENEKDEDENERKLRLKGQMIYMTDWRLIMFLGTPVYVSLYCVMAPYRQSIKSSVCMCVCVCGRVHVRTIERSVQKESKDNLNMRIIPLSVSAHVEQIESPYNPTHSPRVCVRACILQSRSINHQIPAFFTQSLSLSFDRMPKLSSLLSTGLYINDLSMHDFSR